MKRFTLLSLAAALLTACGGSGSVDLGDENAGLGWRPVDLAPEGATKIYATDYLLSELDEWTFPEGLTVKWQQDSAIWRVEGRMKQPLGVASIEAAGGTYHLVLRQAPVQEVEFSLPLNPGDSAATAYLIGSFNAWNRSSHPMARDTANVARLKINLKPGRYEYKFTVGGIEVNDPANPTKVPNGLGGANDILVVNEPGQACAPIRILDEREGEVAVKALPEGQELIAFWNTYQVPVRSAEDGSLRVAIPSEAGSSERSQLHLYTFNADRFGGEAMIPLHEGHVVNSTAQLRRDDWESATMYFALVDRFSNGNPLNDKPLNRADVLPANDYHGGDVEGVQQRLEKGYFESLGFNTIWLSPLHRNPQGAWGLWNKGGVFTRFSGYHGYWPTSTSKPDARMGTADEIRRFNQVAHDRNLNTLIDFVGHHVHLEHPVLKAHPDWITSLYLPDSSLNTERWDDHRLTTWFDKHLPTLNSQRPDVVMAMTDSALPWVQDYGFDGFRHDASKHVDLLYWRTLTRKLKEQVAYAEGRRLYQIGETYGSPELINSYVGSGMLDAQFDFNLYDAAVSFFGHLGGTASALKSTLEASLATYGPNHLMGNISGNQDRPRFVTLASGHVSPQEDTKLAGYTRATPKATEAGLDRLALLHAFNCAIPGIPVCYYGDEVGLEGANDPDNRRDMDFEAAGRPSPFSKAQRLLRSRTTDVFMERRASLALCYGQTTVRNVGEDILVITRTYPGETMRIVLNRGDKPVTVRINDLGPDARVVAGEGTLSTVKAEIPARNFAYIKSNK
jgi:cyclomaltodextrinase